MNVMRPRESPASSSMVTRATPIARRSSVFRRSTAMPIPRAASARAMAGMAHFSVTIRLKNPVNFETCDFDTTVTPSLFPWVRYAFAGLNSVMPLALALSMML